MIQSFSIYDRNLQLILDENPNHYKEKKGDVVNIYTGEDMPVEPVPQTVSPRQIRIALTATGLRSTVENAVKAGSQDLKDWWEYALDIERGHPLIVSMAQSLGVNEQQLDDLFSLAATL